MKGKLSKRFTLDKTIAFFKKFNELQDLSMMKKEWNNVSPLTQSFVFS